LTPVSAVVDAAIDVVPALADQQVHGAGTWVAPWLRFQAPVKKSKERSPCFIT
jgi:hypothetical protein